MLIHLDKHSGKPVFRQIVDQVSQSIAGGNLRPGDKLASVRELAKDLRVNPMTVSKAYSTLETDGLVERRKGVGIFVAYLSIDEDEREAPLREALERASRLSHRLGVEPEQALHLFAQALESERTKGVPDE